MSQMSNQLTMMKNLYNICSHSNNPIQLLEQMSMSNPNLQPIISLFKQGYSPEQVFNQVCNERGLNADSVMNEVKSMIK